MSRTLRTLLVAPAALLTFTLIEDAFVYKLRQWIDNVHLRVFVMMLCIAVAFAVVSDVVVPKIRELLRSIHRTTRRGGGSLGVLLFYGSLFAALYWAFLTVETRGMRNLLPASMR